MKTVCFFISNIENAGGTERVTTLISNEFSCKKFNVLILSLHNGTNSFFKLNDNIKCYSLFNKKNSMKKNGLKAIFLLRKFLLKEKVDVLISVDSVLCIFSVPALSFLKIKHICWEHFNFKVNLGVKFRDFGRVLAARYCDYVVTLTHKDKLLWEHGLKNINAKIVPIANPSSFKDIEHVPTLENKVVLSIGRLTYQKGYDLLLEAWAFVCKQNTDWILRIVGSGEDRHKLEEQARLLGLENRVDFVGQTQNIDFYYRSSSFFCMSSRFEGLPMVLLEAQSYGLPIIAFDCDTGPSEIISGDFLVPFANTQALGQKILNLIDSVDVFSILVANAKENSKKFDISFISKKWINIL